MTMMGDTSGPVTSYPENWKEMTPQQKQQWRLHNFVNGAGINFTNAEAKKNYMIRAQRFADAYLIKEPDRVPVSLPAGDLPFLQYGLNAHTFMYDPEKAVKACEDFNKKYAAELEYYANPFTTPTDVLDIMDYKLYAWPGHGLSVNAPGYQFVEGEYMKPEEYDDLLRDPSDFWLRTYLPRVFGIFDSFKALQPLTNIIEIPTGQLFGLTNPAFKETLRKILEAGDALEKRLKIVGPYMGLGPANGYPTTIGTLTVAPFDCIGDTMRGTAAIMKDMYRRPDKLMAAMDKIADILIHNILAAPGVEAQTVVMFPLHKGADGWMSQKQFDTFYFPTLKKMIDAFNNEGLTVILFAEGAYNTRLEAVNVFPKGFVVWYFDQTDMVKAKKILGEKCCLMGNVPSSLMVTGDPKDVTANCKKLIEDCGKGGGYILTAGCMAENPKLENLRAMLAAAKEYGTYKKK
jgi:hypothetical protein